MIYLQFRIIFIYYLNYIKNLKEIKDFNQMKDFWRIQKKKLLESILLNYKYDKQINIKKLLKKKKIFSFLKNKNFEFFFRKKIFKILTPITNNKIN